MRISTVWAPAATSRVCDRTLLAVGCPIGAPSISTMEPTGAPVTMISVGFGAGCGFREPNQLQADRHANVIRMRTLTLDARSLVRSRERITEVRKASPIPGPRDAVVAIEGEP